MAAESESPASQKGNGSAKPKIKIQLGDMTHNNIKQLQVGWTRTGATVWYAVPSLTFSIEPT